MKPEPGTYELYRSTSEASDTTVGEVAPARPIEEVMASWPMRSTPKLSRDLYGYALALVAAVVVVFVLACTLLIAGRATFLTDTPAKPSGDRPGHADMEGDYPYADGAGGAVLLREGGTAIPAGTLLSGNAALADLSSGTLMASCGADELIYPASMTKVMTLIVVVENLPTIESLTDTVTVSQDVFNRMVEAESSGFGFKPGSRLTVEAMLYALMLKSDGIAACELARYVAGTEAAFVELMNKKAQDMGLTKTHFMNPTGLHHKEHTSTVREIASIMAYAMDMDLCRRVMTAQSFKTTCTEPDGSQEIYTFYHNLLVTQFDKTKPNQPTAVQVTAGKTGYTPESRYCLVTYAKSTDGMEYVCVTADAENYVACIQDYLTVYNTYVKP